MAARKKKVFKVERKTNNYDSGQWIRMKGQFVTKEDAQAYIDELESMNPRSQEVQYKIGKEDKIS
jgi:hypothetical protein